ncbi:hypothetical protein [Hyphomicrobium sp. D-2]|nr:hypothetical protein [Hyphomicrobium sp. D-2]MDH4982609.1 hypothetical protein [Hyphomicrobium sp. D-2]
MRASSDAGIGRTPEIQLGGTLATIPYAKIQFAIRQLDISTAALRRG